MASRRRHRLGGHRRSPRRLRSPVSGEPNAGRAQMLRCLGRPLPGEVEELDGDSAHGGELWPGLTLDRRMHRRRPTPPVMGLDSSEHRGGGAHSQHMHPRDLSTVPPSPTMYPATADRDAHRRRDPTSVASGHDGALASRPVGGVLSSASRRLGDHPSVRPTSGLSLPRERRTGRPYPTFGLAPGGVCRATRVTPGAGALLPHRFTLTCARRTGPSAVCSLWHFPAGRPDWPLASTLPSGAPTFLRPVVPEDAGPRSPGRLTNARSSVARDESRLDVWRTQVPP
jgi:hypothetical protein